ncbi:helix-turn-helix transcriptional regulator [Pseudomonas sp. Q12-87]|uniref:helix-turn-helix domain-containing protein n=1 Tax=Pseudomonas sp. Q12-87 TaxID=177989 RepID=UPI00069DBF90|nr:helix-turn-helix transcriptional regulator [Pseudomonas sp. Q12-87]
MNNAWGEHQGHPHSSARRDCGQRLKATLEEYGIAPVAFAELLGISPQCLTNWSARGIPRLRIAQLARLLSVSEVWLATGEGERAGDMGQRE